ncbi:unnamed protein product [Symbiodinium sp. CCMP2592]|nr:unnamed protein product [Symbiodinium sp. CCMP2592]
MRASRSLSQPHSKPPKPFQEDQDRLHRGPWHVRAPTPLPLSFQKIVLAEVWVIRDWGRAKVKCKLSEAAQADAQLLEVATGLGQTGQPCLLACQVSAETVEESGDGHPELEPAEVEVEAEAASSSRFGAFLGSASSLRMKASPFLSKARQAIVEEAKLVTDDVRDIAGGVREGMQLTKQDLQAQTKNWRSAIGARWRSFGQEKEERTGYPPETQEADGTGESPATGLQAVRQNLAMTADVSKDMWRDVKELKQEVMSEVRHSVHDLRQVGKQVFGGTEAIAERDEGDADAQDTGEASDSKEGRSPRGLGKVKTAVFRKAGDLREGLRNRLQEESKEEAFWILPSTRANYAELSSPPNPNSHEAVNRVRSLGGKLKGSLARKGREVSSGVVSIAQGVRQKGQSLKEAVGTGLPAPQKSDSDALDANLGDSIFAIGSDEEDAWSDADDFWDRPSDSETAASAAGPSLEGSEAAREGPAEAEPKEPK